MDSNGRSTVVAGTPGQQYVDNVFFNPDNDYEMLTTNRSQYVILDINIVIFYTLTLFICIFIFSNSI